MPPTLLVPGPALRGVRYAPMLSPIATRSARNFPFASRASSAVETLSRPCSSVTKPSRRSDVHFTGRPKRLAAQHERGLGIGAALHAEAAADLTGDHVHIAVRDLEDLIGQ